MTPVFDPTEWEGDREFVAWAKCRACGDKVYEGDGPCSEELCPFREVEDDE